ncbi:MAG: hypothetical protein JJW00_09875 [Sulfurimonas sp.]|nr:hypothetical protein [Sulfurimonas sp.]
MNESETRAELIDPKLRECGWGVVEAKSSDNEKLIPTILTTSQKLSRGIDARNIRNIVLMRVVKQIIEFQQHLYQEKIAS